MRTEPKQFPDFMSQSEVAEYLGVPDCGTRFEGWRKGSKTMPRLPAVRVQPPGDGRGATVYRYPLKTTREWFTARALREDEDGKK